MGCLLPQTAAMSIKIKRVYEPAEKSDGVRILVDRLWPRGTRKSAVDLWIKDVAPSDELRKWFHHEEPKWAQFRSRYLKELARNTLAVGELRAAVKGKAATLVYSAKDEAHNQAIVLAAYLKVPPRKAASRKKKKKTKRPRG